MKAILFSCIFSLAHEFDIRLLCRIANVSRSGYYKWVSRKNQLNRWQRREKHLMQLVQVVHSTRPSFGYRRIADRLRKEGSWSGSNRKVLTCMQKLGIQARVRKKRNYGVGTEHHSVSNLLKRNFQATKPLEKIVSDVTYLHSRGTIQYMMCSLICTTMKF